MVRSSVPKHVETPSAILEDHIPENWIYISIAEALHNGLLLDLKDGNHGESHPLKNEFSQKGSPFITASDVKNFQINFEDAPKLPKDVIDRLRVGFAKKDDVILTHKASVGRVSIAKMDCILSPQTTYYRTNALGLFNKYLMWMLASPFFQNQLNKVKSQTTRDYVSISKQYKLFIRLAPLNEQKRIVEKIEALFSQIDSQFRTITQTNNLLKMNKKSILKDGFNGNLTKIWREKHKIKKSKVLLEKIENERKTKNLEKFEMISSVIPSNFTNDWEVSVLGFVTENHDGKRIPVSKIKRKNMNGKYPYYGASGIIDYVDKPLFKGKYLLIGEDGANLLTRSTPIAFIADGEFWVNNHAHVLKTLGNIPLKFISYFINSIDLSEWVTGTAQPKLNQRNMNKIPIPIPSVEEQIEIVKILEQNLSLIDKQLDFLKIWHLTLSKLRTSILEKAFEGKMVPQDPNDEHVKKLLKIITS